MLFWPVSLLNMPSQGFIPRRRSGGEGRESEGGRGAGGNRREFPSLEMGTRSELVSRTQS